MMKLDKKNKYTDNPRTITKKQFGLLDEHIKEFGDLSGVVYCVNQKAFVSGNMRSEILDGAEIEIVERFEKPTKHKTAAYGFINFSGEKFAYREVAFTKAEFKKACVVANSDGGAFDWDVLLGGGVWQDEPLALWGLDLPGNWSVERADMAFIDSAEEASSMNTGDDPDAINTRQTSEAERFSLLIFLNTKLNRKWQKYKDQLQMQDDSKAFNQWLEGTQI